MTSVDKANVLETSGCGARSSPDVHAEEFPDIELEHMLVDNAAMQLVAAPRHFDVIVTENMFGDILTDEAAMLTGSIGHAADRVARASDGTPGLFEPVHGSAPDIAGKGIANPLGDDPVGGDAAAPRTRPEAEAAAVESAVDKALEEGVRTGDLGGDATTAEATEARRSEGASTWSQAD